MTWPDTNDANNLEQTFIKDFLDVSGNIIRRGSNDAIVTNITENGIKILKNFVNI